MTVYNSHRFLVMFNVDFNTMEKLSLIEMIKMGANSRKLKNGYSNNLSSYMMVSAQSIALYSHTHRISGRPAI